MKITIANSFDNRFNDIYYKYLTVNGHRVNLLVAPQSEEEVNRAIEDSDLVLSCWSDNLTSYLSKNIGKRRLITFLRSYEALTPQLMKSINWHGVDALVFVADHIRKFTLSKWSPLIENIPSTVIWNSVVVNEYCQKFKTQNHFDIGYLGYLNHKKGIELLVQCIQEAVKIDDRYRLHIAGQFQEERFEVYFRHIVKELGLQDNIIFYGWIGNVSEWMATVGSIISTSPWEGCPNNVIEAMASGIKPIIHNWPGSKEIFPEDLVFSDLGEFVRCLKSECTTEKYREYVFDNFNAEVQVGQKLEGFVCDISKRKRIVWIPLSDHNSASSRLRAYTPAKKLSQKARIILPEANTFPPAVVPDVMVLQRVYQGNEKLEELIKCYQSFGTKVVLDLCDIYPEAKKIAHCVDFVSTNHSIRIGQFKELGWRCKFEVVSDPLDYSLTKGIEHTEVKGTMLVWFGTYSNISNLEILPKHLTGVAITSEVVKDLLPSGWAFEPWAYESFIEKIRQYNLCVLPQRDIGKTANKLLVSIASGIPTVCSDIPAYREILQKVGLEEYLCKTENDWERAIDKLSAKSERLSYLKKAQEFICKKYSIDSIAERWWDVFRSCQ